MVARAAALLLLSLACVPQHPVAPPSEPTPPPAKVASRPPPAPRDPDARFAELERRLLGADRVQLTFDVVATGVVEARLRGLLIVEPRRRVRIDADGTFAGAQGTVSLEADAFDVRGRHGDARFEIRRPDELDRALLVGLTRMGVLHNLALLWSARPPDHADGGVTDWVVTADHRLAELDGTADAIAFDIAVDGQPVGDAKLLLDADGWPTLREQIVRLPAGEMKVVERYEAVEID